MDVAAYIAGILTIPTLWLVVTLVYKALSRDTGYGGCAVCDHRIETEIGQYTRIGLWIRDLPHRLYWCNLRWHRDAVAAYRAKWYR